MSFSDKTLNHFLGMGLPQVTPPLARQPETKTTTYEYTPHQKSWLRLCDGQADGQINDIASAALHYVARPKLNELRRTEK